VYGQPVLIDLTGFDQRQSKSRLTVPDGLCRSGGRRDNSEMLLLGRRLQESSPEGSHTRP
jgi:hypothetical protein